MKAARAREHLDSLCSELQAYYDTKPCVLQEKDDLANNLYRIRINVSDPPERLSLIAGDVFGCLRASLDHLVWSLCTLNSGAYAEYTQFPIMEDNKPSSFKGQIKGLAPGAETIIESLQPYHGKDRAAIEGNLLWRLNRLCNIDKHRRIPLHGSVTEFKLPASIPQEMVKLDPDGDISFPLHMKSQVIVHEMVFFEATFGDSHEGIECDRRGIEAIYKFVTKDVLPKFDGFF
jgi:hypothetical protein